MTEAKKIAALQVQLANQKLRLLDCTLRCAKRQLALLKLRDIWEADRLTDGLASDDWHRIGEIIDNATKCSRR